jgi:hypothetical protein
MPRISAKSKNAQKLPKKANFPIDRFSEKPQKGRPRKIQPHWVRGRADNYRWVFGQIWDRVGPRLVKAETRDDVLASFREAEIGGYELEFVRMADLMLQIVQDSDFPKSRREAQINFLADSLGGEGAVTPRSSRDICARERARIQNAHKIIRYEVWIECSCGYKGRSRNLACPKCQAEVPLNWNSGLDGSAIFNSFNT